MLKAFASLQALVLALMLVSASTVARAGDVPEAVKSACRGDFLAHCHDHEPGSSAARDCMAGVFDRLSEPCVSAILDSNLADDTPAPIASKKTKRMAKSATRPSRKAGKQRFASRAKPVIHRKQARAPRNVSIARRIAHGLRVADRYVARAFRIAFR